MAYEIKRKTMKGYIPLSDRIEKQLDECAKLEIPASACGIEPEALGALSHGWFPLGQGRGIKWTLWKSSVTFQRQEKQGDRWIALEELHVAPKVLKELAWRAPLWLDQIENKDKVIDETIVDESTEEERRQDWERSIMEEEE